MKSMFIKSFPSIVDEEELTEENVKQVLIKLHRFFNDVSRLLYKLKRCLISWKQMLFMNIMTILI